jgi:hypothetical protein
MGKESGARSTSPDASADTMSTTATSANPSTNVDILFSFV